MANPIEDTEGLLTIGILIAIIIGAAILFNKFDLGKLFGGLPLFPNKTPGVANPASPPASASADNPLSDVQGLGDVFTANNPQELSQKFFDWFSGLFHFGGSGSPSPTDTGTTQQGTPAVSSNSAGALSGDTVSDYNPPADSVQQGTPA